MGWSGGSYTKGNAATGGWTGDASLGIGIEAGRHDTQDNDFATGINQCINKDGSNSFTADANLGGFKPTNIGAGTAAAPAVCVGNDVNTGVFGPAADTWAVATNGTERMRVDSTGQVGIGTTAPAYPLDIIGNCRIADGQTNSANKLGRILGRPFTNADGDWLAVDVRGLNAENQINFGGGSTVTNAATSLAFYTAANTTTVNGTERMQINNSGEVLIGKTTSLAASYKLQVGDATGAKYVGIFGGSTATADGSALAFFNGAAVSGQIGNYSSIQGGAYDGRFTLKNSGSAFCILGLTAAVGTHFMKWNNVSGAWTYDTSSARYKENIANSSYGLDAVLAMRPVTFTYKAEPDRHDVGFIAEEMMNVVPEVVAKDTDGNPDAISYDRLTSVLCKAIQELEARVAALEGA